MKDHKSIPWLGVVLLMGAILLSLTGCGGAKDTGSSITILIPEDPAGFNGIVTDTGYEQLLGELMMLSVSEMEISSLNWPWKFPP